MEAEHRAAASAHTLALDGLSGVGKSTVGRAVATRMGWRHLDTGAAYRAATVAALAAGAVEPGASGAETRAVDAAVAAALPGLAVSTDPAVDRVTLGERDVTREIRSERVTSTVSAVSSLPAVRTRLVAWQRAQMVEGGWVCEGRDIGSVVVPDAAVKVWLDAAPEVRAARRGGDRQAGGGDLATVVRRRDELDAGRAASPARPAPDAVVLDTGALTRDQVVRAVLELLAAAGLRPA